MVPKLSIIVPVYNVEKYLNACVESILAQTFEGFELILVDDGSPDASGSMCDEWARRDVRIRVVHKQNGGVAAARNAGMKIATGTYITFVDADDMVYPDTYDKALQKADAGFDVVAFGFENIYQNRVQPRRTDSFEVQEPAQMASRWIEFTDFFYFAWNKVYKRSLLQKANIGFDETLRVSEDYAFNCSVLALRPSYALIDACLYRYFHRENHSTLTKNIQLDLIDFELRQFTAHLEPALHKAGLSAMIEPSRDYVIAAGARLHFWVLNSVDLHISWQEHHIYFKELLEDPARRAAIQKLTRSKDEGRTTWFFLQPTRFCIWLHALWLLTAYTRLKNAALRWRNTRMLRAQQADG